MEVSERVCEGVEVGVSEIEGARLVGMGVGVRVRVGVRVSKSGSECKSGS